MTRYASALVTGASSGIGREFARVLAARGCDLVLVARREDRLRDLAAECSGVSVEVMPADLSSEDGVALVESRLRDQPVELLVNNAGVGYGGMAVDHDPDDAKMLVAVNVVALHRLTQAALPGMVDAGHGGVLNVSSMGGEQPVRGFASYAASKAFVTTYSESLYGELRGTGVHITVLKPGYVFTEMTEDAPDPSSLTAKLLWLQPDRVATAAIDAVEKGQLICVPGRQWRATAGIIGAIPRPALRAIGARLNITS